MSKKKFYTCKSDKAYKCVFLNPLNQDLLSLMIKETTHNDYSNITYSNIEKNTNIAIRRKYLDVLLDSQEAILNIEVNGFNLDYIKPRNTSFHCDNYANYTLVNGKYTEEKVIMQINYSYGVKSDVPIKKYMILNTDRNDPVPHVKNFIIYVVYMDYCMKFWYNRNKQGVNIKQNLENIIKYKYFIMLALNLKGLKELIKLTHDERIEKFMNELKKVNSNPKFREYISEEQDKEFILNSVRDEGIKKGIEQGKTEGIFERNFEIAKNMLKDKLSVDTISKYTGLSINQINNITF